MQGVRNVARGTALTVVGVAPPSVYGRQTQLPAGPLVVFAERNAAALVDTVRGAMHCGIRPPSTTANVLESADRTEPPRTGVVHLWAARLRRTGFAFDMGEGGWETFATKVYRDAIAPRGQPPKVLGTGGRVPRFTRGLVPRAQHAWETWVRTTRSLYGSEQAHLRDLLRSAHQAWSLREGETGAFEEQATMARLERAWGALEGDDDLFALFAFALAPAYARHRCRATEALGRWVAAFLPEVLLIVPYGGRRLWWAHGQDLVLTGHSCAVSDDGRMCVATPQPMLHRAIRPEQLADSSPWTWEALPTLGPVGPGAPGPGEASEPEEAMEPGEPGEPDADPGMDEAMEDEEDEEEEGMEDGGDGGPGDYVPASRDDAWRRQKAARLFGRAY